MRFYCVQVHPEIGSSGRAMDIMNTFIRDVLERLSTETQRLALYGKKKVVSSREIQTAIRLLLPGELSKHAVAEGTKATTKFANAKKAQREAKTAE